MRNRRDPHEEERLSALLDDELSEPDALEVTRHLAVCDACMTELEEIRSARVALRGLPGMDPPPALFSDVLTLAPSVGRWTTTTRLVAAGIAAGSLVGAAAFAAGAPTGQVVPPVENFVVDHVARIGGVPMITPVDLDRSGR